MSRQWSNLFFRAFALSWVAYFGLYLCRKNFSVLMPYLKTETGISSEDLANALFAYSLVYALGQFAMGRLADRIGPRRVAGVGMLVSAAASAMLAWPAWMGIALAVLAIQAVNGAAQSSGWPSVLRMTRDWFPERSRGTWMGWWSTHLVVGGFAGTGLAARSAEAHWTYAAWVPSLVLSVIAILFLAFARDAVQSPTAVRSAGKLIITPPLVSIAVMYFCVKLTRYAFLFWLPLYMTEHLDYARPQAGYASSVYELVGVLGAIGAGYMSERLGGIRFPLGSLMMFVLAILCATFPYISATGLLPNLLWIALIGVFTFGPDTLMAGAAVQDLVPPHSTAAAGGFVNGIGSTGQVLSPLLVAWLSVNYGWPALFSLLALVVFFGGVCLATQWVRIPRQEGGEALP